MKEYLFKVYGEGKLESTFTLEEKYIFEKIETLVNNKITFDMYTINRILTIDL